MGSPMSILSKFVAVVAGAAIATGAANAAPVSINGVWFDSERDFATSVDVSTGELGTIGGASSLAGAVGADLSQGVRCSTDACSFVVEFDNPIENTDGDDFVIYGLGTGSIPELFDIAVPGMRLTNFSLEDTGQTVGNFALTSLSLDLSDFGIALGETISRIKIIVNPGTNPEEFVAFASLNEAIATPLPAGFLIFLGGAAGLFGASRKKNTA